MGKLTMCHDTERARVILMWSCPETEKEHVHVPVRIL